MIRTRLALVLVLCLAGCASAPPERSYYLLRAEVPAGLESADPDALTGVGPVEVAPYLDRAGVVVQTDANQIREARYHLWAEPLAPAIRYYLSDRVATALGRALNRGPGAPHDWRYRIEVSVEEFHGTLNGQVRLVARWSLLDRSENSVLHGQRFSRTREQTGDGYPGLIQTQISLLDELAEAIARALREVGTPST